MLSVKSPLPQRLKEARLAKGLSQQKLGLLLGMEHNTASARMNQYERGKHQPDYLSLYRIAAVLDVPVAYFFCEETQLARLICQYYKLPEETRLKLDDIIYDRDKAVLDEKE